MNKDTKMTLMVEIDVDNGYGQYIIIDDSFYEKKDTKTKEEPIITYCDDEYNEYLTHCEHYIDYGPPVKNNIERNTNITQNRTIVPFTNPLICVINHIVNWIIR